MIYEFLHITVLVVKSTDFKGKTAPLKSSTRHLAADENPVNVVYRQLRQLLGEAIHVKYIFMRINKIKVGDIITKPLDANHI